MPQLIRLPQPSPAGPQAMFCCAHVSGLQVPPSSSRTGPARRRRRRSAGAVQVPHVELVAAAVAGRAAGDVLLRAGERRAGAGVRMTALAGDAAAAARLRRRARAARCSCVAAAVARGAAGDVLRRARRGLARRRRPGTPHCPDTPPPPQVCGGVHVPQHELVAAAVARRAAVDALLRARLRRARAAVRVAALTRHAAAAAGLRRACRCRTAADCRNRRRRARS